MAIRRVGVGGTSSVGWPWAARDHSDYYQYTDGHHQGSWLLAVKSALSLSNARGPAGQYMSCDLGWDLSSKYLYKELISTDLKQAPSESTKQELGLRTIHRERLKAASSSNVQDISFFSLWASSPLLLLLLILFLPFPMNIPSTDHERYWSHSPPQGQSRNNQTVMDLRDSVLIPNL